MPRFRPTVGNPLRVVDNDATDSTVSLKAEVTMQRSVRAWLGAITLLASFLLLPRAEAAPESPAAAAAQEASATQKSAAPGPTVAGDWQGTLEARGGRLRLAIHVTKGPDGTLKASFDSLDQGAMGIPVDKATFDGGVLRLDLSSIGARYEGTLGKEGTELTGAWAQGGGSFPLTLTRPASAKERAETEGKPAGERVEAEGKPPEEKPVSSDPIAPMWVGTLDAGGGKIRIVFNLARGEDGTLTATIDSPDQMAKGMPVRRAVYKDGKLTLELKQPVARFEGTMNKEGTELTGTWTQGGTGMPLVLTPITKLPALNRPQEPARPLPYAEEEVAYTSQPAGVKIACTLTLPRSGGPFPGVILITGSGPQDRDEAVFGHRPFLVLSDHLTRKGLAVLRCDDRGVGGSGSGPPGATTQDFVDDVLAGVTLLKAREDIDPARIGLIGHSEGGLIAPSAAVRSKDVSFIVMMAGPGLPGDEILEAQGALMMKVDGVGEDEIARVRAINRRVYAILKEERDDAAAEARVRTELAAMPDLTPEVDRQMKAMMSRWFRHFLTHDPRPTLAKLKVPVLAIAGERDLQVPAKENIAAIRSALEGAGHEDHTLLILPGLNHPFQECNTGSLTEYASIEQTISPVALESISGWILARTKPR